MIASEKLTRFERNDFIQLADDKSSDIGYVHLVRNGEPVSSGSYVVAHDGNRLFFAQLATPNRNVNVGPDPYSSASLEASIRIAQGIYEESALLSALPVYEAQLLRMSENGSTGVVSIRPRAGVGWGIADLETVEIFLELPTGSPLMEIGKLRNVGDVRVPVVFDAHTILHHLLIAGSTGSGKTNTNTNLVRAATDQGFCVFLFDHKPDFQNIHKPNQQAEERAYGFENTAYWTLSSDTQYGNIINVKASGVSAGMLAYTVCYRNGEENQAEVLESIIDGFADNRDGGSWSYKELTDWIYSFDNGKKLAEALPFKMAINERTFSAILGKVNRNSRVPEWLRRANGGRTPFGEVIPGNFVDISQMLVPGQVNVIHVPKNEGGRGYALFLSYLLRSISKARAEDKAGTPRVLHVIDEASDIFASDNRNLKREASSVLSEEIRKGRSLGIGFVISLQSAGDCPEEIRHNLNTNIAFRHRHPEVLKSIFPSTIGLQEEATSLGKGEALMEQFGVPGVLRVKMNISPCELS